MKRIIFASVFLFCVYSHFSYAESYPSVSLPSFGNVSSSIAIQRARSQVIAPQTNGQVIKKNDYVIVDDKNKPSCVFYLNYASSSGQVTQYADVGYVNLKCNR
ncbi:MAG: hypothetical protein QX190_10370 [Methylococcales bacterium]